MDGKTQRIKQWQCRLYVHYGFVTNAASVREWCWYVNSTWAHESCGAVYNWWVTTFTDCFLLVKNATGNFFVFQIQHMAAMNNYLGTCEIRTKSVIYAHRIQWIHSNNLYIARVFIIHWQYIVTRQDIHHLCMYNYVPPLFKCTHQCVRESSRPWASKSKLPSSIEWESYCMKIILLLLLKWFNLLCSLHVNVSIYLFLYSPHPFALALCLLCRRRGREYIYAVASAHRTYDE